MLYICYYFRHHYFFSKYLMNYTKKYNNTVVPPYLLIQYPQFQLYMVNCGPKSVKIKEINIS
jgi:hypothetical protein